VSILSALNLSAISYSKRCLDTISSDLTITNIFAPSNEFKLSAFQESITFTEVPQLDNTIAKTARIQIRFIYLI